MFVKNFKQFLLEQRDKPIIPAGDETEYDDGSDPALEDEVNSLNDNVADTCPRCGEDVDDCCCSDEDPWSTHVHHRAPKGKIIKGKPKQNFKK